MALTIYGSPRSRTLRTLWMAAELGLDYTHVPLAYDDPQLKQPGFLAINPAGTIPAIVERCCALAESLAINLYLAKKYGSTGPSPLYPASAEGETEVCAGRYGRKDIWSHGFSATHCFSNYGRLSAVTPTSPSRMHSPC